MYVVLKDTFKYIKYLVDDNKFKIDKNCTSDKGQFLKNLMYLLIKRKVTLKINSALAIPN